ncbi:unnamed protein product, partial [Amoebophrya sp. A25]|eukprot:GSA25T00016926001.1
MSLGKDTNGTTSKTDRIREQNEPTARDANHLLQLLSPFNADHVVLSSWGFVSAEAAKYW